MKLSLLDVRVNECGICLSQFKDGDKAGLTLSVNILFMKCVLHVGWHEINPALCVGFRWMWTLDNRFIVKKLCHSRYLKSFLAVFQFSFIFR